MRNAVVLDAGVLNLHFIDDPRVEGYFDDVEDERTTGYISTVNLAEFYYKTCQKLGRQTADTRYYQLRAQLHVISNDELARDAGLEKCRQHLDLSLADCFALALTKRQRATLLTTDSELLKVDDIEVKLFGI